jgi:hypothetical protein
MRHTQSKGAGSSPPGGWLGVRPALGALGALLVGCASMNGAAEKAFTASHPGCQTTVRAREDLQHDAYEVTGCGSDVIYACQPEHWVSVPCRHSDATCLAPGGPICSESSWNQGGQEQCAGRLCDSVDVAARKRFVKDKACPLAQVTATPHAPVIAAPPPDVAADPERMRGWTMSHEGHTFRTATGCGSEVVYDCRAYGDGSWGCVVAGVQ